MKKSLTHRFCEAVKAKNGRVEISDSHLKSWNLILRVTPQGAKTWCVQFRLGGKRQRITLGAFPSTSLERARAKSLKIGALVDDGIDPIAHERQAKLDALTFEDAAREYLVHCRERAKLKSWRQKQRLFEKWVLPRLGTLPLSELDRGKVLELLDDLEEEGLTVQVNRVLSQIKAFLFWVVEDREYLLVNPIASLHSRRKRFKETPRERTLSNGELRDLWEATHGLPEPSRSFIRVLMLTGQRRDEVRLMEWSEIDLEKSKWLISARRTKNKRDHLVPLSAHVVSILSDLPRKSGYVFSVKGSKPYTGHRRLKAILDRESGVTGWVFHDLRRTFRTGLSALRIQPDIRRRCMNHATGTSLDGVYDQHDFVDEKRQAFEAWADHLLLIVEERDGENVVTFGSALSAEAQ